MHGYDNKRVERDEIVNRVPPTLLVFVTNNNKLIQFMISFFLYPLVIQCRVIYHIVFE